MAQRKFNTTNEYRDLPSATAKENEAYFEKARIFLAKTGGLYHLSGEGATAIADYLAYIDGKQLLRK